MSVLEKFQPERVLYYFEEICKIPHGSGNTKEISDYLVTFAREKGLICIQDESNNVIIKKGGSPGYEDSDPVILQGHMDMVCEKTPGSSHDFTKEGLKLFVEGDYIQARETTLGGDDGIAVAYCLAILEDDSLVHPPLEVVLTVDEEIGLLGANALDFSHLEGKTMINLDSEEEGIFFISCAGGTSSNSELPVRYQEGYGVPVRMKIHGLVGGHSGAEIHKNRANAHMLMGRALYELREKADFALSELSGGGKETAIARECSVLLLVQREDVEFLHCEIKKLEESFRREYMGIEPELSIHVTVEEERKEPVLHPIDLEKILFYLNHIPNGVQKMSGVIPGLVETSNNLGVLKLTSQSFIASSAPRSSVESARDYVASKIQYLTEFLGGDYTSTGTYPAWEYKENSRLQKIMVKVYEQMYQQRPVVQALHAGLECGIFYNGIKDLDCVSIGPDIIDIHTTKEKMSISSVQRTYEYLLEVLKELK